MSGKPRDVCPECMEHGCVREGSDRHRCPSCGRVWPQRLLKRLDAHEAAESRERARRLGRERARRHDASRDAGARSEYQREWRAAHADYMRRWRRNRYWQAKLRSRWCGRVAEVYRDSDGYLVVDACNGSFWETGFEPKAALMWSMLVLGADAPGARPFGAAESKRACMSDRVAFCDEGGPRFAPVSSDWGDACAAQADAAMRAVGLAGDGRGRMKNKNVLAQGNRTV